MQVNDLNPRDPLQFIADYWITPTLTEISKYHLFFSLILELKMCVNPL